MNGRERSGFLVRLDVRVKLLLLLCTALLLFARETGWCLAGGAVLVIAGVVAAPVGARDLLRRLRSVAWFGLVIVLVNAWTVDGTVLLSVAGRYCTAEGMAAGLLLAGRVALLAAGALVFTRTTPLERLMDAIDAGAARLRPSLRAAAMALHIALMFGPVLVDRARQLSRVSLARGPDADEGFPARFRRGARIAVPLFVSAFRSADHLGLAMQTRCYDPRMARTPFAAPRPGAADITVALLAAAATLTLLLAPAAGG